MNTKRVVLASLAAGVLNLALTLSMAVLVLLEDVRAQVERYQLQPPARRCACTATWRRYGRATTRALASPAT
ncbi:MAG: hypothetical protein ACRD4U_09795 [Candidatus Acidiferrales bacterium]